MTTDKLKTRNQKRGTRNHTTAFTLIELLIAIAIIAILAAIALPNFLEAQIRAKVAKAQADMRSLAGALEAYRTDYNEYPPTPIALGPGFRDFRPLTTPVAYIAQPPRDPFWDAGQRDPGPGGYFREGYYRYGAMPLTGASRWALASDGPDRVSDTNPLVFYPGYTPELFFGGVPGHDYTLYDPTNGTLSRGDIFRASDLTSR